MHLLHDHSSPAAAEIGFDSFLAVDIRIGKILTAAALEGARKPAYRLTIDFGATIGIRKSSAQVTQNYAAADLPGKLVAAVVNFPPRQIGKFISEVLVVGFPDENGAVVLFSPDRAVPLGSRLF